MSTVMMNKKDELIMRLVHYFITEEDYSPIIVNGVKDEIWLENNNGPYKIIRINSNNIFNKEQLSFDTYKINSIVKQIKKKTLSFRVNTLNIQLNLNEDLKLEDEKNISQASIPMEGTKEITDEKILEAFPNINEKLIKDANGLEFIMNVTKDINKKTEENNRTYEKTFSPKKLAITPLLIVACMVMFAITCVVQRLSALGGVTGTTAIKLGANYLPLIEDGEIWRLITHMFLHGSAIHLLVNMYSLFVLGTQLETFVGKLRFLIVYLISGIVGGLLSCALGGGVPSVGASGAIFGLMGAMLYFGYHYRTYIGAAIKSQIIPIIVVNLIIGMSTTGIDNWAHIGGLIGGALAMMAVGVEKKSSATERINGSICLLILIGFLSYLIFFR